MRLLYGLMLLAIGMSQCSSGYYFSVLAGACTHCTTYMPYCSTCTNAFSCTLCYSGHNHQVNNFGADRCVCPVTLCSQCASNQIDCVYCNSNYHLRYSSSNGTIYCKLCEPPCICSGKYCSGCDSGAFLTYDDGHPN